MTQPMAGGRATPQMAGPRHRQIANVIAAYTALHGYPPSQREIADAVGLSQPSVHRHLTVMAATGVLLPGSLGAVRSVAVAPACPHCNGTGRAPLPKSADGRR